MPEQEMARLTATVRGRVHGVGYRIFVIERAGARGLRGYTRNDRSGTVEVVAEGARAQLEGLLEELRRGPIAAHVTEVETLWGPATGEFAGFRVRY
ncbi:MAG TPA: acylphosphatase [Ktedonobacterales bacterium]|jgi:acylphosphatase